VTARRWSGAALATVALSAAAFGQGAASSGAGFELVGEIGGTMSGVAVDDGYLYLVEGDRLVVMDASGPLGLRVLGRSARIPGQAHRLVVDGGYAYVAPGLPADPAAWLHVVDVRDPMRLERVGVLGRGPPVAGQNPRAMDLAVAGGLLLVAGGAGGLRVVDVRDPRRPREVGALAAGEWTASVAALGSTAYVVVGGEGSVPGLRAVDLSDPTRPREVGHLDTGAAASGVVVSAGYALVTSGAGLHVIDVADPSHLKQVGGLGMDQSIDFAADIALIDGKRAVLEVGESIPIGARYKLLVVDLTDPSRPRAVAGGNLRVTGGAIAAVGDRAYVVAAPAGLVGPGGIWVYHIDDSGKIREVAQTWALADAKAVALDGGYAYLIDWYGGLSVIEMSVPERPALVGRLNTPSQVSDVAVVGEVVYVAHAGARFEPWGVQIVDVSNPWLPFEQGFAYIESASQTPSPMFLSVAGDYVFVTGGGTERLWVLDVSEPAAATEVSALDTGGPALGLDVAADAQTAYVATAERGLLIVDVGIPSAPQEIARVPFAHPAVDVAVIGHHAFVATGDGGLHVLDVRDARAVRETAVLPDVAAHTVEAYEDFIVASSRDRSSISASAPSVWLVDVAGSDTPRIAGTLGLGEAGDVAMWGNLVAVAGYRLGLFVARTGLVPPLPTRTARPTSVPTVPTATPSPTMVPEVGGLRIYLPRASTDR